MTELLGGEAAIFPERDELTIEEFWTGRMVVVAVAGDLDILTTPQLDRALHSAMRARPSALIVDLTRVDFLASVGMNLLVAAHHKITPTARFGVVADGPATSRPMKLIGIDSVIALYQTLDDALAEFRGRVSAREARASVYVDWAAAESDVRAAADDLALPAGVSRVDVFAVADLSGCRTAVELIGSFDEPTEGSTIARLYATQLSTALGIPAFALSDLIAGEHSG
jgi:anti-sigma B factor antagonist